jgi:hypothetical protein
VATNHIADPTEAHPASAISATGTYSNVQEAINNMGTGGGTNTPTLQDVVNASDGPVTNAPYLVQTNATDVSFAGFRFSPGTPTPYLQPSKTDGIFLSSSNQATGLWIGSTGVHAHVSGTLRWRAYDTFRVYHTDGVTNLPVYLTLTNHAARITDLENAPGGVYALVSEPVATNHIADPTAAHAASAISATGTYSNVQEAINAIGSTANIGAIATMYKTSNQTIPSGGATLTWEATTNSANTVGCNDLNMASVANERFVFSTAGTGVYAVACRAAWGGDACADGKVQSIIIFHYNGTTTNSISAVQHVNGGNTVGRFEATAVVAIRSTSEWINFLAFHDDSDAGAETVNADNRTWASIVKIK